MPQLTPLTTPKLYAAQTTTVRTAKNGPGALNGWFVTNPNASTAYVQFFDVAGSGTVTLGTTVPVLSLGIPSTAAANMNGCNIEFVNGIRLAVTTTATGSTAPSTGCDVNVWVY